MTIIGESWNRHISQPLGLYLNEPISSKLNESQVHYSHYNEPSRLNPNCTLIVDMRHEISIDIRWGNYTFIGKGPIAIPILLTNVMIYSF